jgi:hypothetical protein
MTNEEFFKDRAERCLELAEQFAPSIAADGFKVLAADYAKQAAKPDVPALAPDEDPASIARILHRASLR